MDSISNLSLLEIAAEDDSLLFDASTSAAGGSDDPAVSAASAATAASVFSCSPLLSLRSLPRTDGRVGGADSEKASSAMNGVSNKENMNWNNKPEAPKLSVEPQQMKRKKKGGGYNLRKSLAWDRAFFTEEGVLNPLELSMISGTATPKRTNTELKAIHEEEEPASASLALQEIEEKLFKQSSDGVVCIEDRNTGAAGLSPKSGASTKGRARASMAKRKVLAVNDVVANRPKRNACPRPAVSSSLKGPEPAKAANKESKVTRIPGPRSNVSAVKTAARGGTLSTGFSKRNQNAPPATNVQKYAGAKGVSKNPRTVPSNPKVDLADKCSVTRTLNKQAEKQLDSSAPEIPPPSGLLHPPGTGAHKVSEACLPQGVSDTGEKKQQRQFQTTKPSGLRMPSPSLGFFSQAKASNAHSQLQKRSISCKPVGSSIPKLSKLETYSVNEARLPPVPRKKSENIVAHVNLKSKEQAELHNHVSDMEFPRHAKKLLSKSHAHEQLEKEADHPLEDKLHDVVSNGNQSIDKEPQSMQHHSMHRTLIKEDNISYTVQNAMGKDEEHIASDVLTLNESFVLQEKDGISSKDSRHSGEFKEYNCVKTAAVNSSISDFSETVLGGCIQGIPCKNVEQLDDSAGDFGKQGGDAQANLLNGNFSVNCNDTTQSILEVVNQQLQQINTPNLSIVGETNSENENESQGSSCRLVHVTTLSSKRSSEKSIPEIAGACESEPNVAESEDRQHPADDQSGFIQRKPVDEGYHQVVDSKGMHNRTQAFELDRICEDCVAVSATVCSTEVNNVSPESRPCYENNIENLHVASQLCPAVKDDSHSRGNDMLNDDDPTISQWQLTGDGSSRDTSMRCDVQCDVPGNPEQQANTLSEWQLRDDGSSMETSMHFDVRLDVQRNFEQQADTRTYSETNEMICEDESLVANHGRLLDESEFSEVTVDFILKTQDSIYGGSENPSGLLQHTVLAQSVREFDHTNRESEESHVEDEQGLSFVENPAVNNCNSEHSLSVINDQFPLVGDNDINESHLSELQRPSVVVGANSHHVDNIMHLDGDGLPADTAYSEEIKKQTLFEGASEGCNIYTSEYNASNHHTQAVPENTDGNFDDERAECLQMGDVNKSSTDILPAVEVQLSHKVVSDEFDSSIKMSEGSIAEVVNCKSDEHCSSSENSKLPASDNLPFHTRIPQSSEVSSQEAETNIFEKDEFPNTDMQDQTKDVPCFAEDSSKITHLEESATKSQPEVPSVMVPPNAVPFSDEWLAAIEAAGEEILTMKGGAVQNSPPEKPQHEPGPWSPVRKNQAIGPFDCTKHTNIPHSNSS